MSSFGIHAHGTSTTARQQHVKQRTSGGGAQSHHHQQQQQQQQPPLHQHDGTSSGTNGYSYTTSPPSGPPTSHLHKAKSSISSKRSLSAPPSVSRVFARTSGRLARGLVVVGALLALYTLTRTKPASPEPAAFRTKLDSRWWENKDQSDKLVPRPRMPPRPPRLKPQLATTHTHAQLTHLASTASTSYTAILHVESESQVSLIGPVLSSLQRQSVVPERLIVFARQDIELPRASFDPSVEFVLYSASESAVEALLRSAGSSTSDHLLLIDGAFRRLASSYAKSMLRVAGTKEYSSMLLTGGGMRLPLVPTDDGATCVRLPIERTIAIQIPTQPTLMHSSWLAELAPDGVRTDLPLQAALSLAMWAQSARQAVAIPLASAFGKSADATALTADCEKTLQTLVGQERRLGALFRKKSSSSAASTSSAGRRKPGAFVVLLGDSSELEHVHEIACGVAQDSRVHVLIIQEGLTGSVDVSTFGQKCHLDAQPIARNDVVDRLVTLGQIDVALYLADGPAVSVFDEALVTLDADFGPKRGAARRSAAEVDGDVAPVAVVLSSNELQEAQWMSALPLEALRHWHTPRIDLAVVTNNRAKSLQRLVASLEQAEYYSDHVNLLINLEQTSDRATQKLTDGLSWPHGTITLKHRVVLGGLMPAIVESWYPASNDSYGVLLEDDVEVSPMFYGWLKFSILSYRYGSADKRREASRMFGISLYQPRNVELRPEGRQPFDAHALFSSMSLSPNLPYLSQVPCSWGAAYFPEHWKEFHQYLSLRLSEIALPISDTIVPDIKSNRWPRSWKKYFIELVYMRGYLMLYPNYDDFISLSTNHVEKGEHIHNDDDLIKRKSLFEVPLMARRRTSSRQQHNSITLMDLPEGKLPALQTMPVLDLWGSIATSEDLIDRGYQTLTQLSTCPSVVQVDRPLKYDARELLCRKEYDRAERLVEAQPLKSRQPPAIRNAAAEIIANAKKAQIQRQQQLEEEQEAVDLEADAQVEDGPAAIDSDAELDDDPVPVNELSTDVDAVEQNVDRPQGVEELRKRRRLDDEQRSMRRARTRRR
ncbi:hypothetical protein OIV83_001995 [Microbotryomycetes sp. JL201]|nr:hypothetical protein OIV83_001995 [Microbotryomycetes sp. JL201]